MGIMITCYADGTMLKDSRLTVQFARGTRPRNDFQQPDRTHPRPRRTAFRMQLTGLAEGTSWQVSYQSPSLLVHGLPLLFGLAFPHDFSGILLS
jgi:hypothetical protein